MGRPFSIGGLDMPAMQSDYRKPILKLKAEDN